MGWRVDRLVRAPESPTLAARSFALCGQARRGRVYYSYRSVIVIYAWSLHIRFFQVMTRQYIKEARLSPPLLLRAALLAREAGKCDCSCACSCASRCASSCECRCECSGYAPESPTFAARSSALCGSRETRQTVDEPTMRESCILCHAWGGGSDVGGVP